MEKSDFELYYHKGGTYILPIETFNEIFDEMESWKKDCKQKENIIKEVREKIESVRIFGLRSAKTLISTLLNDILEILDKGE